ncbi:MAG: biosynthetic arginine decarboxylase [Geitlerinemataceae cyanobacterium]
MVLASPSPDFQADAKQNADRNDQPAESERWTIERSEDLYRIRGWGEPYFGINAAGRVTVSPKGDRGGAIDLYELVESLKQRNLGLPLLIRFSDILEDRLERLNACFAKAIARYSYPGQYRGVFPVKCNQQRHVVEDLVRFGVPHGFGLEAGSKPELLIALAMLEAPGSLLICNGYKDRGYMETAMLAQKLGHLPIVVLEQPEEVDLAIEVARKLGVTPCLGVRSKLCAKGVGRWGTSSGDRAKFGLNLPEIVEAVEKLRGADMLGGLQLLHFHIGSQISSIVTIKDAIREAGQIYVELAKLGANMQFLDVGGGLAVDYDGSKTSFYASKNYNMQNYANDIVAEVKEACEEKGCAVPTLVSESGRAIASHQSVLIFDVVGTSSQPNSVPVLPTEKEHLVLRNLRETYNSIDAENFQELYHDAVQFKDEAISLFNFGYLSITERAKAEQIYWASCRKILEIVRTLPEVPTEFEDLEQILASIYYINLSIFQSAPDCWAIDQLFPILPIHRLNEEPTERGTLADLTCDSDGKFDRFIDRLGVKPNLELHCHNPGEPYYLGMFLVGAYQEIMGNLHNMFGDTNTVHVQLTNQGGYAIEHVVKGDTMDAVLSYVQYDGDDLLERIRQASEAALRAGRIEIEEAQRLLGAYEEGLRSYTYLNV